MKYRKNNLFFYIYIFFLLTALYNCQKAKKKTVTKPAIYKFSPVSLEFRFVGTNTLSDRAFKNVKKLVSSTKNLLQNLIYTNLSKKNLILDKKVLDNFNIKYNKKEPLVNKKEELNHTLVVLFTFEKRKSSLRKTKNSQIRKSQTSNLDNKKSSKKIQDDEYE